MSTTGKSRVAGRQALHKENAYCPYCFAPLTAGKHCTACGKKVDSYASMQHQLHPGTVLAGEYLLGRVLGEGGFGVTYLALRLDSQTRVAIKEYFPTHCAQRTTGQTVMARAGKEQDYQKGKKSFLQEADLLAGLSALPSVVRVEAFFEELGTAYMVMEYLDGEPLVQRVKEKGRLSPGELLPRLQPLLRDIGQMHEAGLLHRDISPDNIMWMPDGTLRLLDFGSARSMADGGSMTVMLKQGFAPVEQYRRTGQGPWTDVYAMAGTIYYCLTGTMPPEATSRITEDTLRPPSSLGVALTQQEEAALMWALTVLPEYRPQTMDAFAVQLFSETAPRRPTGKRRWTARQRLILAAAAVAALLLLCLQMGLLSAIL